MTINFSIPVLVRKEGEVFVAECPALDVLSQGCDAEEARRNLVEAVSLFLGTCIEMGTFSQVLKECGLTPAHNRIDPDNDVEHLNIPLPFISHKDPAPCHA